MARSDSCRKTGDSLLDAGGHDPELQDRVDRLMTTLQAEQDDSAHTAAEVGRDRNFIERLNAIRLKRYERGESGKTDTTDTEYKQAFEDFGVNVEKTDPAEASRRLRRRSNPLDLAFYLDDWALFRAQHPAQEIDAAVDRDTPWHRFMTGRAATRPGSLA